MYIIVPLTSFLDDSAVTKCGVAHELVIPKTDDNAKHERWDTRPWYVSINWVSEYTWSVNRLIQKGYRPPVILGIILTWLLSLFLPCLSSEQSHARALFWLRTGSSQLHTVWWNWIMVLWKGPMPVTWRLIMVWILYVVLQANGIK